MQYGNIIVILKLYMRVFLEFFRIESKRARENICKISTDCILQAIFRQPSETIIDIISYANDQVDSYDESRSVQTMLKLLDPILCLCYCIITS